MLEVAEVVELQEVEEVDGGKLIVVVDRRLEVGPLATRPYQVAKRRFQLGEVDRLLSGGEVEQAQKLATGRQVLPLLLEGQEEVGVVAVADQEAFQRAAGHHLLALGGGDEGQKPGAQGGRAGKGGRAGPNLPPGEVGSEVGELLGLPDLVDQQVVVAASLG